MQYWARTEYTFEFSLKLSRYFTPSQSYASGFVSRTNGSIFTFASFPPPSRWWRKKIRLIICWMGHYARSELDKNFTCFLFKILHSERFTLWKVWKFIFLNELWTSIFNTDQINGIICIFASWTMFFVNTYILFMSWFPNFLLCDLLSLWILKRGQVA